jgi:hypothetical protein
MSDHAAATQATYYVTIAHNTSDAKLNDAHK